MDYSSDETNTSILKRAEYERKRRHRLKKQKQRKSESEDEIETSPTSTTCQIPNTLHSEPQPVSNDFSLISLCFCFYSDLNKLFTIFPTQSDYFLFLDQGRPALFSIPK